MGIVPAQMRMPKNYSKIRRQFPEKYLSLRSDDKNTWSNSPTADPEEGDRLHWGGKEQGVHLLMVMMTMMMMMMMTMIMMMTMMMGMVVITRFVLNLLSAACTAASKEEASKSCRKIFKVIFSWSLVDVVIIFLSSSSWSLLDVVIIITIIIVIWTIMTNNVI